MPAFFVCSLAQLFPLKEKRCSQRAEGMLGSTHLQSRCLGSQDGIREFEASMVSTVKPCSKRQGLAWRSMVEGLPNTHNSPGSI